ncbi:hypothetical protein PEC730217_24010 [Pectobacterium carotovorum subsp. carotovorum]|nr:MULTISPECIES: DUF2931 family protein [Pectobacterium]GKV83148.1 hypothetical protein PEC106664_39220 [Pectobacterium carotovorum subsp. carotovorum]AVT60878.1 lipoprotein [Pectobacterium versatile]MBQ4778738.1 DUF2931 family protein [Pectobacterium versatile]POY52388.1 hypothetical protein F018LOC_04151 [Pectobacterium versatile]PRI18367.1 hypothetical protein BZY99_17020 [Pectobacterium versatile]
MFRHIIIVLGLCFSLMACATTPTTSAFSWRYGTGSNIDSFCTTQATFYHNGKVVSSYPGGGCNAGAPYKDIIDRKYYWAGGGGLPTEGVPVPDRASIEMVSFYDRKRYRITVDLPANLAQQMQQRYQIGERIDQRNRLYFGLAPGGYYEVVLMGRGLGVSPDLLLARGIAEKVTDDWYDKKVPVARQYGIDDFDKEYGELFKQHPIPLGIEWAPIMDAYRAKQPKTDQQPIK